MSSRRIARELAIILMPQLPKEKNHLERSELDKLASKSVQMLTDYAKQCLADANAFILRVQEQLAEQEIEHPDNKNTAELKPVQLTSEQIREHAALLDRALHFTSEALDMPQIKAEARDTDFLYLLTSTYVENREQIDKIIHNANAKWRVERMVSIDRDIIRLACTEAFYLREIPINVAISEAVELSHRFADARAAKFINGVLADIGQDAEHFRKTGELRQSVEGDDQTKSAQRI